MSASTAFAGSWASLPTPLTPWILDAINAMGHTQMTPVQASTIPLFMKHKDVVVEAVTGSGKTLAFVIPVLEKLLRRETRLKKDEIGALVISPTRELATQIHSVFQLFLSHQSPSTPASDTDDAGAASPSALPPPLLLISSDASSPADDVARFRATGAEIVIGTPGRVEDFLHMGRTKRALSVAELEVLVLDEADRLLDLGFQAALARIVAALPKQRRTGLFSATMTDADALSELVRVGLRNPARIVVKVQAKRGGDGGLRARGERVEERRIPANLQNFYLSCKPSEKLVQLARIVAHETGAHGGARFIVYFATCACVDYFYRILTPFLPPHTTLHSLHGHLPPAARTRTLTAFTRAPATSAAPHILLATDVAARGLDLPDVDAVVQFDPPGDPKAFSHRCGRTARAGRSGRAWVMLCGRERAYVDFLAIRKIPIQAQPRFEGSGAPSAAVGADADDDDAERADDPAVAPALSRIRALVAADRALYDKAAKAFVSSVRAYSKHEAAYIFRVRDLDLVGLARAFGLLRLPRMPELKERGRDGWADADVDWDAFAYTDPAKETKRRAELREKAAKSEEDAQRRAARRAEKEKERVAWSRQSARKEVRELRKDKKVRRRQWEKAQQVEVGEAGAGAGKTGKKRGREEDGSGDGGSGDDGDGGEDGEDEDAGEWEELKREERMAKKVRRGDVSQGEFDAEFAGL